MNRKQAPPIIDAVDFNVKLKPYSLATLSNGIPVYSVEAGTQDVLQIELVFYAGNYFEEKRGVAAATNFMLRNGTTSRTAFQINEAFEYYGAYCNRSCYNETSLVSLHTLSRHVDKLLPVMEDMLTASVFPEQELEIYKQNVGQRLKVNLQKCEFVAGRLIDKYLYGEEHPYGRFSNMEEINALTTDDLKAYYKKHYLEGKCVIFVAGKIPGNLFELLEKHFGKLQVTKPYFTVPFIEAIPEGIDKFRIINDPQGVQGAIRIAAPFPNRHHPDFKKVVVLNTLFGGYFGSRLMSNIREEKGYTYGIYSYLQNHIQQSAWMISTEAGKDVCESTITEIYKEMQLLRDEQVDEEELLLVRNYMIGGILGDLDGPFQIMAKWKNIILNGLNESYFYESVDVIKTISAAELQALANTYLLPEKFYELVVY